MNRQSTVRFRYVGGTTVVYARNVSGIIKHVKSTREVQAAHGQRMCYTGLHRNVVVLVFLIRALLLAVLRLLSLVARFARCPLLTVLAGSASARLITRNPLFLSPLVLPLCRLCAVEMFYAPHAHPCKYIRGMLGVRV